ncbi:hypothetical protein [Brassicibacter mesophilus]|uniref:hypothetical protein n=1 Tax=Brassicibacter mesophilus TaxID=745119 RepID=UPI003D1FFB14
MFNYKKTAEKILTYSPSSVCKYKILTEILNMDTNSKEIKKLRQQVNESKWVKDIVNEQRSDGSWGRFHSQNSKIKQKYSTTEKSVNYLNYLGLKRGDNSVDRVCNYMESLLNDLSLWPDSWEDNKWYKPGAPLFASSKLSVFGSSDKRYKEICEKWIHILSESFSDGKYSESKANSIGEKLLGVDIHDRYIGLNSTYNLTLYSNNTHKIPKEIQRYYLHWLHTNPKNICYKISTPSKKPNQIDNVGELSDWIIVMKLLSNFDGFYDEFRDELQWLINSSDDKGLWDLDKALSKYKLSDNWRSSINRKIDQTIYVLSIFRNY